jgi:hypothetical protein
MFGADRVEASDVGGVLTVILDAGFTDYAGARAFTIEISDTPVSVSIDEQAGRTQAEFIAALTTALQEARIDRGVLSATGISLVDVPLSNLIDVVLEVGNIELRGTDFVTSLGYDAIDFAVSISVDFRILQCQCIPLHCHTCIICFRELCLFFSSLVLIAFYCLLNSLYPSYETNLIPAHE